MPDYPTCPECHFWWLPDMPEASHDADCPLRGKPPEDWPNATTQPAVDLTDGSLPAGALTVMIREARDLEHGDVLLLMDRGDLMPFNVTTNEPDLTRIPDEATIDWRRVFIARSGSHGQAVTQEVSMPALRPCIILVSEARSAALTRPGEGV